MRSLILRSSLMLGLLAPCFAFAQESGTTAVEAPAEVAPAKAGVIGAPAEGKGQVVFFRPPKLYGAAAGFKVREGEVELGKLRSGKYFVHTAEPGKHEYVVHSETKDILTMEIEAGETYYVQGGWSIGIIVGRPNLSPSDEATFNKIAAKLKLAE